MHRSKKVSVSGVPKLGEILVEKGFISLGDLNKALKLQEEKSSQGEKALLGQLMTEMELVSYSTLYYALDEQINWLMTELGRKYHQTEIITELSTRILSAANKQELIAIINNHLPAVDYICLLHLFEIVPVEKGNGDRTGPPPTQGSIQIEPQTNIWRDISPGDFEALLSPGEPLFLARGNHPPELSNLFGKFGEQFGFQSIVFLPIFVRERLEGFLFIGSRETVLTLDSIQYHDRIAQLTATGLERVAELEVKDRNLKILDTLDRIGQAISLETDLDQLYQIIHQQIIEVMGDVDFLIATYDPESNKIDIPYAFEEGKIISLPSFPLGEGLTSILIHKRQPLMLVENTQARAEELGAKIVGLPAKSWLGVPLLIAGEPTGAMVVQDSNQENRFNHLDLRLLSSLASHTAVAIRNALLFQKIREKSKRERILTDFTTNVWSSSDMETILKNALAELGRNLDVDEGYVELEKP